eukprot:8367474-Pyramimonas_sp.AAC.1
MRNRGNSSRAKHISVSAASRAWPHGRDPADAGCFFADAPRGTNPSDRISAGSCLGIQTAR